jgi:hypothetical protein
MTLTFPNTNVRALNVWKNYSATIERAVPTYCEIEGNPNEPDALERHASAVCAILGHCFAQRVPVRTIGSTWSFSSIVQPDTVVIDPGNMSYVSKIPKVHYSASYQARAADGFTPVFVEGGTGIGTLNLALGSRQLALQTSGAGDGHRIGGCIATGTHGSAFRLGALHDTVLALYLIVGPNEAVFVQSATDAPFLPSAAQWLESKTKVPTRYVADDRAFAAALVSLGSFGFVFGVLVEATRLYRFQIKRLKRPADDSVVRKAIESLDTRKLHPQITETPHHFDVVMHPYPLLGKPNWFATLMWKRSPDGAEYQPPLQGIARTSSDTIGLIGALVQKFSVPIVGPIALSFVSDQIHSQLDGDAEPEDSQFFAGQVFGPTTLPAGTGASTEIIVDHQLALPALDLVYETLREQALNHSRYLLGCVALRFVPKTRALLGMNQFDMNCYIELPSIRNGDVIAIYNAIWNKLEERGINFTCHWGQLNCFTPARVTRFFGPNATAWKQERRKLLGSEDALQVFASPILQEAGLAG